MEFFMGLLGAAAGALLFGGGWLLGRRQAQGPGRAGDKGKKAAGMPAAMQAVDSRQWRELVNFLNYDGGEMPAGRGAQGEDARR